MNVETRDRAETLLQDAEKALTELQEMFAGVVGREIKPEGVIIWHAGVALRAVRGAERALPSLHSLQAGPST